MVMLMLKRDSIRDVIAFPKVQNAGEPMSGCPETVEEDVYKRQVLMSVLAAAGFLAAPGALALFRRDDAEVIAIGALALRAQCVVCLLYTSRCV